MKGEKNAYWCRDCHGYVVTLDVEDGVTPMFLACRVGGEPDKDRCSGTMESMMYPSEPWPDKDGFGHAIPTEPTWEWYKPRRREYRKLDAASRDHVDKGGLLLRRINA